MSTRQGLVDTVLPQGRRDLWAAPSHGILHDIKQALALEAAVAASRAVVGCSLFFGEQTPSVRGTSGGVEF